MRILLAAASVAASVAVFAAVATAALSSPAERASLQQYGPTTVQVCGRKTSGSRSYVTLTIPRASLAGYLQRGATVGPCVYGSVKPGGAVSLRTSKGQLIKKLDALRMYSIVVTDASRAENFHVFGTGVNKRTGLAFRGTVRWKLRFAAGRYQYRSDAHPRLQRSFATQAQSSSS